MAPYTDIDRTEEEMRRESRSRGEALHLYEYERGIQQVSDLVGQQLEYEILGLQRNLREAAARGDQGSWIGDESKE